MATKATNSRYTSAGAVPHTAKFHPSNNNGYHRSRTGAKSLVEHSKPLYRDQLDELNELMETCPDLVIPQSAIHSTFVYSDYPLDDLIMYERKWEKGWKDATRCAAQYGIHKKSRVPRRIRKRLIKGKKARVYADTMYFAGSAHEQRKVPDILPPDIADSFDNPYVIKGAEVVEPRNTYTKKEVRKYA